MLNFLKEINYAPEWKGDWAGWKDWTRWRVAKVLEFPKSRFSVGNTTVNKDNNLSRFDTWKNITGVEDHVSDKIQLTDNGINFTTKAGVFFLPYGLWDKYWYQDAVKRYDVMTLWWIISIFWSFNWVYRNKDMYNDVVHTFFKDVMKWEIWSYIWLSSKAPEQDDDTKMYRIQWLTYDQQIIWWNIPEDTLWEIVNSDHCSDPWMMLWFASNGLVILDPSKQKTKITEAFSFPN